MTEENQDITIHDGDYLKIKGHIIDADDITCVDAQVTIANTHGGKVVLQYDQSDPRFSSTASDNCKYEAVLYSSDTSGLATHTIQEYYYEIEIVDDKDGTSRPHTVTSGTLRVKPSY